MNAEALLGTVKHSVHVPVGLVFVAVARYFFTLVKCAVYNKHIMPNIMNLSLILVLCVYLSVPEFDVH